MSLIAIGDIHGCIRTLDALLDRLAPSAGDHLVFLGDYVDRGPDSKAVVARLIELEASHACTFLRGNHEALMLTHLGREDQGPWRENGGVDTLRSYFANGEVRVPEEHLAFLRRTKLYHDTPDFFFVHAGIRPDWSVARNVAEGAERTFLWKRNHIGAKDPAWEKPVVCGHVALEEPILREKLIAIDTGCAYGRRSGMGRLTAIRLPERALVQIQYVG